MIFKIFSYIFIVLIIFKIITIFSLWWNLDVKIIFQNPSYLLEKTQENVNIFNCDNTQTECKVNYNLEVNEWDGYKSVWTKYICEWNFWIWEITWEENKCNPNTVTYPKWEFKTTFFVKLKSDESYFYTKEINIKNPEIIQEIPNIEEEILEENTSSWELNQTNSWSEMQENTQTWEVLEENNSWSENWENTQTWEILQENTSSGWVNQTNSWSEILENTQTWEILEENTSSWEIIWEQTQTGILETEINSWAQNSQEILSWTIFSSQVNYILQSPSYISETSSGNYICDRSKTDCKINFNLNIDEWNGFKSIWTKYECVWSFGFWEITWEENKCNPNTITYPVWDFETKFKVIEKSNTWVYFEKNFFVKNQWFLESSIPTKIVYVWGWGSSIQNINIPLPKIIIQSWIENSLCTKEDCSINLNYETQNSKEACLWDFPGGTFENTTNEKCNPWYVKYWLWDFKVTLKVYQKDNPANFQENYLYFSNKKAEKPKETEEKEIQEEGLAENEYVSPPDKGETSEGQRGLNTWEILQNYTLKISKVLPNPIWADNLEFIEIENFWEKEIDLKNCFLDDEVWAWSKAYKWKETFLLNPGEASKFYKFDTKININNSKKEEVNLFCFDTLIDNLTWEFSSPEWFIVSFDLDLKNITSVKKQKDKNIYEISYNSWDKKTISFDESFDILDNLMKENISKEAKKQKLYDLVEKSFYQKISKQKSWVKIYGTTFPNTNIIFQLEKQENEFSFLDIFYKKTFANEVYQTKSDKNWSYEFYLKNPNIWEFEVKTLLSFWENIDFEISKKSSLEIDEEYLDYINSSKTISKIQEYIPPKSIINLQWKITSNKTFSNNKLVCFDTDECSVNLDGSQSQGKNLKYFWDYWNLKTFDKKNPASYKFWVWKHIISLTVSDEINTDTSYFMVEVQWKTKKEKSVLEKTENKTTKNNKIGSSPVD